MNRNRILIGGGILLAICGLLTAQDEADPPSRVARLNYLGGSVSFRPGNVDDWTAATLNYPLTTGDHLWTDRDSGADLHVGSSVVHLADQTAFAILNLDDRMAQLSISQGAMNVHIVRLENDETFEVDTPNGAIVLLRPGDYRVDVNGDANSSAVIVRTGDAEVTGGGQALPVHARQLVRFSGTDQLNVENLPAPGSDQFDQWCVDRDQREDRAIQAASAYVPPDMIGAGDLAGNGVWRTDPSYGPVWAPSRVPMGWEPYHYGHWAYVLPWGWTWIDDAPWGFAPFHYGRWVMTGVGWVWVPGARVARPVYAPALVVFVGGGGFGGGGVAWIPLGPREVYRPYYRVSDRYVRNVNVTHVNVTNINVTNVTYVNQTHVTYVPQGAFTGARPVAVAAVRVSPEAMRSAQPVTQMEVRPARESYMGRPAQPGVRFGTPPARVAERQVVVRQAPPASVRPMGGVRVAEPVRSNGMAPRPQIDNSRPQRTDRPANVYNGRPPATNTPNQPANNAQPVNPNRAPSNVSPQVEAPRQPRNADAPPRNADTPRPAYTRPPAANQPANNPAPQVQQHQQQPEQRQQQRQQQNEQRRSEHAKPRDEKRKDDK